jgi:regulator of protease activity HflC (stomatin/prohibitin superfamily)
MTAGAIALIVLALFVLITAMAGVRIVPQARAGIVERLGRYSRTLDAGLTLIVPFIDRVKPLIDLREQVVAFPPQPVITEDNLVVGIDTVIYFTVTDPKAATYEIANPLQAIEQLTVTTLRNVIGGLTLEETLTSRDNINSQLRVVLDEATGKWSSSRSSRREPCRRRWRSRCAPSATAAPRSSPPRASSSPRSSRRRARSRPRS